MTTNDVLLAASYFLFWLCVIVAFGVTIGSAIRREEDRP